MINRAPGLGKAEFDQSELFLSEARVRSAAWMHPILQNFFLHVKDICPYS